MATRQVNWAKDWKHQDFTGLTRSQITEKKARFKAKALVKIKTTLDALQGPPFRLKSVTWTKERSRPFYYLVVKLTPPAKLVPITTKGGSDGHGGQGSKITPTPPPSP